MARESSQARAAHLPSLGVATYRHARRGGRALGDIAREIDRAQNDSFDGVTFTTAVLAQLDTDTGLLRRVNAGHPRAALPRDGRLVKSLGDAPISLPMLAHAARGTSRVTDEAHPG